MSQRLFCLFFLILFTSSQAQQVADTTFNPPITKPAYSTGGGPIVMLDEAHLEFGKGRVAVFGEAAMFSAQLGGPNRQPVGMNSPRAPQNYRFLLNVMHWLSGLVD